ncbi:hypothetical protein Scep_016593 [Stephania cephalantha]|uniref:COBRA-like protein n=1 Tax=Stephania cephalantha TaxID=152367 RepID=A0AAP0INS8_9MAGN
MAISVSNLGFLAILVLYCFSISSTEAYDALDPNGNITIKWDVMQWTPDGYVAVVTMYNFQQYRHIQAPGWTLGWTWAKKEVIWSMVGGQATEQGDCSRFKGNIPHCCKKDPTVVDLMPGTPYNQQIANCCKGGVLNSWVQDPANAASSFQISVGQAGTTNKTVRVPKNFTLRAPGPGYTCGPARIVKASKFSTADKRRVTQALNDTAMLWGVKYYNDFLSQAGPLGNVQSELLFRKDPSTFTFDKGWAFPRRIYFNGDNCVMPPPDSYPWLPNSSPRQTISILGLTTAFLLSLAFLLVHA